jgi:hypothetical protein
MRIPLDVSQCQSDVFRLTDSYSGSMPNVCPIQIDVSCEFLVPCSKPNKLMPTCRFILNPDGYDFAALTETAPKHQHEALKDVIAKYHRFRPSMDIRLYVGYSSQRYGCQRTDLQAD